jgi:hypothetical protein
VKLWIRLSGQAFPLEHLDREDLTMTSLRALSLAVLLIGGIPAAGFAVTGRDAAGNENGTPGSLTGPPLSQPGASDQTSGRAPTPGTGTTLGQATQNPDPRKNELQEKLTGDGYSQVHDINFGPETTTAKAVKDGKEWRLSIDSHGKVLQQPE